MTNVSWQFFLKVDDAWRAMYEDCARAKVSIDLEQYIFNYDEIGKKFLDLFLKKAKEGVRIRLLFDAAGSFYFFNSSAAKDLQQKGIKIRFFNPIGPLGIHNFLSWFFRDHRKILIVDSKIGYTGGVGINAAMRGWRDTHVRITGPIVKEMEYIFYRMWEATRTGRFLKFRKPRSSYGYFHMLINAPHFHQRFIYQNLRYMIRSAKHYIYLTTPYFIPDLGFFRYLRRAARHGVDVRLLAGDRSDHRLVDTAANSYFELAFRSGIRIFKYRESILHAKTAVIDDRWASVGSANLDNLSFLFNHEANLVSFNPKFVREVKDQFLADLSFSREVMPAMWQERPMLQKIFETLSWPIHKFL